MTIQEAIKAHEAGKKVRHKTFIEGEYATGFTQAHFNSHEASRDYTIIYFAGWEIIEEPLTADELREGMEFAIRNSITEQSLVCNLEQLLNNKRIWEL